MKNALTEIHDVLKAAKDIGATVAPIIAGAARLITGF